MSPPLPSLALCAAVLSAACGQASSPAVAGDRTKPPTLRIELGGTPDATDIARLIAVDDLRAQGYTVETLNYADDALLFVGMQQGDIDMASVGDVVGWNAIRQGAPAFTLMDESAMTVLVLATRDIRSCADLHGKTVGIGPFRGANALLMRRYVERACPGTTPQYVSISSSPTKLAALAAGAVTAVTLEMYDYVELPEEYAERFHVLTWFRDVFPGLTSISTFMRRGLAEEYPETARDVVRAILQARRRIQDPDILTDELVKHLALDPVKARATAETFLAGRIWDVNGRYTLESIQRNIDFYRNQDALPEGVKAEDVADLSYLESVLEEIGRQ